MLQTPAIVLPVLRGLTPPGVAAPPSYALVGAGATVTINSSGTLAPTWGAGANRTTGDLLLCLLADPNGFLPATPAGWSLSSNQVQSSPYGASVGLYSKIAAGGDAAPTFTDNNAAAKLFEFSGNAAVPLDRTGTVTASGSGSTATVANSAADAAFGELIVVVGMSATSGSAYTGANHTMNNGATATTFFIALPGLTSRVATFAYGITSGGGTPSTASNDAITFTGGSGPFLGGNACMASFKHG